MNYYELYDIMQNTHSNPYFIHLLSQTST